MIPALQDNLPPTPRVERSHDPAANPTWHLDYVLIGVVATLLAIGLVMVYSASFGKELSEGRDPASVFVRHVMWIGVGIVAASVMTLIPHDFWRRAAAGIMILALILLVAVLIFGEKRHGATRTFVGGHFQPSEASKLAVVIYVAAWVTARGRDLARIEAGLVPFSILIGLVSALLLMEPSISVTIIVITAGLAVFFVGGGSIKQLLVAGLIGSGVLALLVSLWSYAALRVTNWWQAIVSPTDAPETISTVMEILRRGHGIGTNPSNWMDKIRIPLLWSDYLYANIGADLGFLGAVAVVILFITFGYRCLRIALLAPDKFGGMVAIGIAVWIMMQAAIHMGTSLALIPATGQPLPFMSYGGSSMLINMAGLGLLLSISRASATSPEGERSDADSAVRWWDGRARLPAAGGGELAAEELDGGGERSALGRAGADRAGSSGRGKSSGRRATDRRGSPKPRPVGKTKSRTGRAGIGRAGRNAGA